MLGGVRIDHDRGLAGHSDADVLAHALMDALIGALREGDIGPAVPGHGPSVQGRGLAGAACAAWPQLVAERGFVLEDADCVLVLEEPKIAPHREAMRANLARAMGVEVDRVGVKATTTEGLGFDGPPRGCRRLRGGPARAGVSAP